MSAPEHRLKILPYRLGPHRLITARSYLIDRVVPATEQIALPARDLAEAELRHDLAETTCQPPPPRGKMRRLMHSKPASQTAPEGRILVDLRDHVPSNWAHFLTNHLPLVFALADLHGIARDRLLGLVPAKTPGYISAAAALFELPLLATDAAVTGPALRFELTPWRALRSVRHRWTRLDWPREIVTRIMAAPDAPALPDKVYLARRDTRQVANEDELMALLAPRGFTRVFPEDLPAADQMRLLIGAKAIVAVHGAGMAPLLYRGGCPPAPIVEILPCGHMTDVFRTVAEQMGCPWIGVRGRIKPQYVAPAYALTQPFTQFSLDAFEVDPVSVEIALDTLAQDPNSAEGTRP